MVIPSTGASGGARFIFPGCEKSLCTQPLKGILWRIECASFWFKRRDKTFGGPACSLAHVFLAVLCCSVAGGDSCATASCCQSTSPDMKSAEKAFPSSSYFVLHNIPFFRYELHSL